MGGPKLFDHTDWKSKKKGLHVLRIPAKKYKGRTLFTPGFDARFPKKGSSLLVMRSLLSPSFEALLISPRP